MEMQLKMHPGGSLRGAFRNTTSPRCRGFAWAEWHMLKIKPGLGLTCKLLIRSIYSHPAVLGETCSSTFLLWLCRITGTFLLLPLARTLQPWEPSSSRAAAIPSDSLHTLILYSDNILLQVNDPSKTSCSLKAEKSGARKRNLWTEERSFESEMLSLIRISNTTTLTPSKM